MFIVLFYRAVTLGIIAATAFAFLDLAARSGVSLGAVAENILLSL